MEPEETTIDDLHARTLEQRRADDRRIRRGGIYASILLHLLLFVFWQTDSLLLSPFAAAGPRAGDNRAAGGSLQAIQITVPPTRTIIPPKVPLAAITPDIFEFEPEPQIETASIMSADPGTVEGPGTEDGEGQGDGGTADEGLFRLIPPSPRGMIMPPSNRRLRGKEVQVWVFVDERGRVVPDSTQLRPPTSDGSFNRRLIAEAAEWVFEPAKKGGKPVGAWFPYTISM